MATSEKNLSTFDLDKTPSGANMNIGIVVADWNPDITGNLLAGAKETLLEIGVQAENIVEHHVPGSFELPIAAQWIIEHHHVDGVIVLGSVIQGETRHFEFVCDAVAKGVQDLNLKHSKPVIFGLLTDDTKQQAIDRSGGVHGNKGVECAVACVQMIALRQKLSR